MERPLSFGALDIVRHIIKETVHEGDLCIDATAGRGRDTLFLASLVGDGGHVFSMDIQQEAVNSTRELLLKHGMESRVSVFQKSHSEMSDIANEGTVACITFNFGWLPGGNHALFTKKETSLPAIEQGLSLLKDGGIMTLILYYGKETGFDEKNAILDYLPHIDSKRYTVLEMPFVNRSHCPPIPVVVFKGR